MKFAFSTVSSPSWDFQTVVDRAKEYGYDGVEIRALEDRTASNPLLIDPSKLRDLFAAGGIEVCCLATSISFAQDKRRDAQQADELRNWIDLAQRLGCPVVKIFDMQVKPGSVLMPWKGQSRLGAGLALSGWLAPLADYAGERGVMIGVENALSFRNAKELWLVVDRVSHPSIGVAWDLFNAAMVGEGPAYSVPTLNSKIVYTQVKDAKFGPLGATYVKIGEGDCQVRNFLRRLRGIGYEGYVTVEWEKAWLPNLAEPEEILPDAITKLRDWDQKLDVSDWEAAAAAKNPKKPAAAAAKH
jgi:sugar phosphate isomerase/epimerase